MMISGTEFRVGDYVEHKTTLRRGMIIDFQKRCWWSQDWTGQSLRDWSRHYGAVRIVIWFDKWQVVEQEGYRGCMDGLVQSRQPHMFRKVERLCVVCRHRCDHMQ